MATCLKEQASSWSESSCRPEAGSSSADLARESRFLSNTPALNQEESSYKQFRYIHNHKLHTKKSAFNYILPRRCQPRRENTIMQRYMLHVIIVTCYMLSLGLWGKGRYTVLCLWVYSKCSLMSYYFV